MLSTLPSEWIPAGLEGPMPPTNTSSPQTQLKPDNFSQTSQSPGLEFRLGLKCFTVQVLSECNSNSQRCQIQNTSNSPEEQLSHTLYLTICVCLCEGFRAAEDTTCSQKRRSRLCAASSQPDSYLPFRVLSLHVLSLFLPPPFGGRKRSQIFVATQRTHTNAADTLLHSLLWENLVKVEMRKRNKLSCLFRSPWPSFSSTPFFFFSFDFLSSGLHNEVC